MRVVRIIPPREERDESKLSSRPNDRGIQGLLPFIRICLLVAICVFAVQTHAMQITEVMYDAPGTDTDREWIEIYNDGADALPVASLKLFEANTNHGITSISGGSEIPSGEYAIIAANGTAFAADYPNFSGILTDSSFSLANTGETIAIKQDTETLVSVSYDPSAGAAGNGNTLSADGGSWQETSASPGAESTGSLDEGNDTGNQENTNTGGNNSSEVKKPTDDSVPVLALTVAIDPVIIAGNLQTYKSQVTRSLNGDVLKLKRGIYRWSMGDGSYYAFNGVNEIQHTYQYSGTYQMILEYYTSVLQNEPQLVVKKRITVITPTVIISAASTNGTITLQHTSSEEMNVSGWKVLNAGHEFVFPPQTFLLPKMKYTLTVKQLGFAYQSGDIVLAYPNGDVFTAYRNAPKNTYLNKVSSNIAMSTSGADQQVQTSADINALMATAIETQKTAKGPFLVILIFIVLLAAGTVGCLYLFKKQTGQQNSFYNDSDAEASSTLAVDEDIIELSDDEADL